MSRSKNSRRGSKRGLRAFKEFWSKRASSNYTGWTGKDAKKRTHKQERQENKPKPEDL